MKDAQGHGSNSKSGLPNWSHTAGIRAAVGQGSSDSMGAGPRGPKATPVPLHNGTLPSDEDASLLRMILPFAAIQYRDGQFIRVDSTGNACVITQSAPPPTATGEA